MRDYTDSITHNGDNVSRSYEFAARVHLVVVAGSRKVVYSFNYD